MHWKTSSYYAEIFFFLLEAYFDLGMFVFKYNYYVFINIIAIIHEFNFFGRMVTKENPDSEIQAVLSWLNESEQVT